MLIRLSRLVPGYFRLLQRQVAGQVPIEPQNRFVNRVSMTLGLLGLGSSFYGARQLTGNVRVRSTR